MGVTRGHSQLFLAMMKTLAAALALALALACYAAAGDYTYPKCSSSGTGCCTFGTGSMRNRGYVVLQLDGEDMIVTCKNGTLLCTTGNPGNTAVVSARESVTCPGASPSMCVSVCVLRWTEGG